MRAKTIGLFLSAVLSAGSACAYDNYDSRGLFANPVFANTASESGYDANDPRNCTGPDWDDTRVLGVSKVVASPRIHFVKSPYDDDFKAATCPAATGACRKRSYLETGDLVLVGKTRRRPGPAERDPTSRPAILCSSARRKATSLASATNRG